MNTMNTTNSSTITAPQSVLPSFVVFNVYVMIGPIVLGALVNACLFGVLVVQTYVYYANFSNDHRVMKFTVAAIFTSQVAHVICVSATLWKVAVNAYGNPLTLLVFPLGADATVLFTVITGILVESSFAFRLWKLSKRLPLPLLSLALCLIAQSISLTMAVKAFTSLAAFVTGQKTLITLALTSRLETTVVDIFKGCYITSNSFRCNDIFYRTTSMIDRLVLWTIETGLITSLVAIFIMSFFLAMPQNYIWIGIYATLATVNGNSLFASLNGRLILRSVPNESLNMNTPSSSGGRGSHKPQSVVINVTQTVRGLPEVFKFDEDEV
ncbi:hypothetical protein EDB19DRAFT_2034127 [Suillus lakei]|nr:hypothetical protein EDB19DRAFT_2034127 [Suillus lakei]